MWTRARLIEHVQSGATPDYLLFWGHTPKRPDAVDASCLSQWFPRPFDLEGARYATAEHWMMASKARLFGDQEAEARILASTDPAEAKQIGREVRNYDDTRWSTARSPAVIRGNEAKFTQHPDLRTFLLATADRILVEASPRDRLWGIGLGATNPASRDPTQWRGANLLGFALMEVRDRLKAVWIQG